MPRIYSSTNRIRFTDISEKYAIPRGFKGKQSEVHSAVITYVFSHFKNTRKYRQQVVDALNVLTYCIMENSIPSFDWTASDPLATMPDVDLDIVESALGDLYLTDESIEWDVSPVSDDSILVEDSSAKEIPRKESHGEMKVRDPEPAKPRISEKPVVPKNAVQKSSPTSLTPKEDLYIQSPKYPRFDVSKPWMSCNDGGDRLVIYTTLPEIPTRQNEISITTDVGKMTDAELLALYPNQIIHTRSPKMYEPVAGMDFDPTLGCIFPIEGFSKEEIVDNIIRYPHLYKLKKVDADEKVVNFYTSIEIDGELLPIGDVWDTLPEAKIIPKDSEFAKEYVVRKYLLEEKAGIRHKFRMFGLLDPFLTVFMPFSEYASRGYTDAIEIVKQCVISRVRYKQSRNPILRRWNSKNV